MTCLQIKNLEIDLGEFHLQNIFFTLQQGDYLTIIGPTGAGKTILLESIIGFWKPIKGQIYLEGHEITDELPEKRQIGIVYQDYALLPHFTVFQNIAYGLKKKERNKAKIRQSVNELATALKIAHLLHRKPGTLSGGEQQRVALARALIVEPKLLLMDEPLSALDRQTRRETRHLIRQVIQERQITVIHITHDLNDAWVLANKVAIFKKGRLLQFGSLDEVLHCPRSNFVANFVGTTVLDGIVDADHGGIRTVRSNGFQLVTLDTAEIGEEVKIAIRPENIRISPEKPQSTRDQSVVKMQLVEIIKEGKTSTVSLRTDVTLLDVLVSNNAVDYIGLKQGDTVYAIFHASHVRIIPKSMYHDSDISQKAVRNRSVSEVYADPVCS
jgi:molybdate transport system ATP-binding protein